MLHYKIEPTHVNAHTFQVTLSFSEQVPADSVLQMPAWIPGSYMIRDFARNVSRLKAHAAGTPVTLRPLDKDSWLIPAHDGELVIEYQVYAFDLSVRSAYLDQSFGFFNFSSLCFAVRGYEQIECQVELVLPATLKHWSIATGLPRTGGEKWQQGTFSAPSYHALIDYPVLMGELTIASFSAAGIPHSLVLVGRHDADLQRITADLIRICEHQIKQFDDQVPFNEYLFLTMVVGRGFGGLEHPNSTALVCSRRDLAHMNMAEMSTEYRTFLSLCSHEYFHSWNVKTLKPREFIPYQLNAEQYTTQLWFYEGITSYFDDYVLHQAGLIDANTYLSLIGDTLARIERGQGIHHQTIAESSFFAWTKFYKQDENSPNTIVSYYAKGAIIALCLDLMLREHQPELTLGLVLSAFWREFGASEKGTSESCFVEFVKQHYELDLSAFIERAVHSTHPLPTTQLLAQFGVKLTAETANDDNTFGGKPATAPQPVSLGAKYKADMHGLTVLSTYRGEAAEQAGLSANDRIIAIDHLQVNQETQKELFSRKQPGQVSTIHAFRRDELLTIKLTWQPPHLANRRLTISDSTKLRGWLQTD